MYNQLIWPLITLFAIFLIGTLGFYAISGYSYSLIDCLYMTFITITTIGFHEVIDLSTHPNGRIFVMFISVSGIGVLTYLISHITALLVEGKIQLNYRAKKMKKEIALLKDHYIICGAGKTGINIIDEIKSHHIKSVLIDPDEHKFKDWYHLEDRFLYIIGDGTSDRVLEEANIKNAKGIFVSTGSDNSNLVTCLTARNLNSKIRIISSCQDQRNMKKFKIAGADKIINHTQIGANRMMTEMFKPDVATFIDSMIRGAEKKLMFEEIKVTEALVGKKIIDLDIKDFKDTIVLSIKNDEDWVFNPSRQYQLRKGDILILVTTQNDFKKFKDLIKSY